MPEQLIETGNAATAALSEATGSSIAVELITPGWGSSGYYGAPVLEAAGRDKVFPPAPTCTSTTRRPPSRTTAPSGPCATSPPSSPPTPPGTAARSSPRPACSPPTSRSSPR
jgi:hypothetical protein